MTGYRTIINPLGQKESIIAPLWDAIAKKVAPDQIYLLYTEFNDFITLVPLCAAESIINDFMDHLNQEAFLIDLNAATDEKGNIDWEFFFRYNDFVGKLNNTIAEKGSDFKWSLFVDDYRKSLE